MILLPNVIYRLIFCPFLSVSQQVRSWSWGLRSDALVMATATVLFSNSCPSGESGATVTVALSGELPSEDFPGPCEPQQQPLNRF